MKCIYKQYFRNFFSVYTLSILLVACGESDPHAHIDFSAEGEPAYGGVYVTGSIGEPSNLIPFLAGDSASSAVTGHIYNSLLKYDKNLNLAPDLAKNWEVSPDGMTITFKLRQDVTWQDGEAFNAEDVLATFEVITAPDTRTPYAEKYTIVEDIEAPDPFTVRVRYGKPFAPALASWAQLSMLPAHELAKVDDIHTSHLVTDPVGTGAYRFHNWKRGQELQLIENPDHFEGRPYVTLQRQRIITDQDAQFLALRKGEIDSMGLKPIQYERLTSGEDFTRRYEKYRYMGRSYVYMGFNLNHPLFERRHIRQALSYATPRDTIIQGILMGHGVASFGPFMPDTWAEHPDLAPYPHNPEKAAEMLDKAGWTDTDGDGIRDKDGQKFSFTVVTNQGNDQRIKTAEIMQQAFREIGVDMNIRVQEWATFLENTIHQRNFDAVILGWTLPVEPDPYDVWHSSKTGEREFNFVGFENNEADNMIEKARTTFEKTERQQALWRFQEILHREQPYLFLYTPYSLIAVHKRFKNIQPAPAGISHNFKDWYVPAEQQIYNVKTLIQQ